MLDGKKAYALSKKYTDDSMAGAGAVAGVPCQIQSITPITGGNRVTFLWIDNEGVSHTSTMDVKDGAKGDTGETGATGKGIKSMTINSSNHLIVTYDDDTTNDAGEVPNVQADWNEDDSTADSFIKNKPTLGTASAKDSTDTVRPNSHDLVESNAVYSAINGALSSVYTPRGDLTCAELVEGLLIDANIGNVYQMTDSGTTSALFIQGVGTTINVNDCVGIIKAGQNTILFNYMGNAFDLHDYQKKDLASSIEGASTVEGALSALSTNKATQAEVNDIVNVLGAKNLLPNNAVSQTTNGVTFTVNSDGSVTVNGTASENTWLWFVSYAQGGFYLPVGRYILNGSEQEASDTYDWSVYVTIAGESSNLASDWGHDTDGVAFENTSASNKLISAIWIKSGAVLNNALFKPMIRLASDPDDTYQPYAKTNKELTDGLAYSTNETNTGKTWIDGKPIYRKVIVYDTARTGGVAVQIGTLSNVETLIDYRAFLKGSNGVTTFAERYDSETNYILIWFDNGKVYFRQANSSTIYLQAPIYAIMEYTKTS